MGTQDCFKLEYSKSSDCKICLCRPLFINNLFDDLGHRIYAFRDIKTCETKHILDIPVLNITFASLQDKPMFDGAEMVQYKLESWMRKFDLWNQ